MFQGTPIWRGSFDGNFFEQDIPDLLASGAYNNTDLLIGATDDEGTFFTFMRTGTTIDQPFVDNSLFNKLTIGSPSALVADLLEVIYSSGIDGSGNYEEATSNVLGDLLFNCNITSFAREVSAAGCKVFMYQMTHQVTRSIFNATWLRAGHIEDTQLVFGLPFLDDPIFVPTYDELKISFYVIQMWTNFAKSG